MTLTTYRQIAHRLRINGRKPVEESERPRDKEGLGCYHDAPCRYRNHKHPKDQPPTTIDLDADDPQTQRLLRVGAIEALPPEPRAVLVKLSDLVHKPAGEGA